MKKRILGLISIFFAFSLLIGVYGMDIPVDEHVIIKEGKIYLPVRLVADEILKTDVIWDKKTKTLSLSYEDKTILLKEETKEKEGILIKNGQTYVPASILKEKFELIITYDKKNKLVNIKEPKKNIPPTALFSFVKDEYVQGQKIEVTETSFDEDGDKIVDRLWMINHNDKQLASSLDEILGKVNPGIYEVSLKVKDENGAWSEWVSQSIIIKENVAPIIHNLEASKAEYAIGEELDITYDYENEEWEPIREEKWTYRRMHDEEIIYQKPKAIFATGDYVITLQLEDAYGNVSVVKELPIHINTTVVETEFHYKFTKEGPGSFIDNYQKFNYQDYKEIVPTEIIEEKGALIVSNSPERVFKKGILYRDTASGTGKLVLHHINAFSDSQSKEEKIRLFVIAQNNTEEPVSLTIGKKSIKGPTQDILYTGQKALEGYFQSDAYASYTLKPGEHVYLYDSKGKLWQKEEVISGIFDFVAKGNVTFTVAVGSGNTTIEHISNMPALNKDGHIRGTFDLINRYYRLDMTSADECMKLVVGKDASEWAKGYDAITGEEVYNIGNYGVGIYMKITAKREVGILLNPRGGIFRGAAKWFDGSTILLPKSGYFTYKNKATVVGKLKEREVKELIYMLPNGSAAPVLIGFIPESEWKR